MATIVEYTIHKRPINAYPNKIVSPPFPSRCCFASIARVGKVQEEQGWPFVYHRCAVCGFTVRRFASCEDILEEMQIWKKQGQAIPTPMRHEGKLEIL